MTASLSIPSDDTFFKYLNIDPALLPASEMNKNSASGLRDLISCLLNQDIQLLGISTKNPPEYKVKTETKNLYVKLEKIKYSELKDCIKGYKKSKTLQINSLLSKKLKYTYINKSWILATISEDFNNYTLEDIIKYLNENPEFSLPIEYIIQIFMSSLLIHKNLQEKFFPLSFIEPSSFCFKVVKMKPNDFKVFLFFDIMDPSILIRSVKSPFYSDDLENFNKNFQVSLGKVLILCLLPKTVNDYTLVSSLKNFKDHTFIPGLSKVIQRLFNDNLYLYNKDFFNFKLGRTWEYLLGKSEDLDNFSVNGLTSAFFFESLEIKIKAMKYLTRDLENATKFSKIFTHNIVNKKFFFYLKTFQTLEPEVGQFLFRLINNIISNEPKQDPEILVSLSYLLSTVNYELMDESQYRDIGKGILALSLSKTLTILHFFHSKQILKNLLSKENKDLRALLKLTSFVGPFAVDFLIELLKKHYIPGSIDVLSLIELIPIHFKLKNSFHITELINQIFRKFHCFNEALHLPLLMAFNVIFELLKAAKDAKTANFEGKCYKNTHNYNISPLMVYCLKCKVIYCVICGQEHEKLHEISYLTYLANRDQICSNTFSYSNPNLAFQRCFPVFKNFNLLKKRENENLVFYEEGKIFFDEFCEDEQAYYTEFYFEEIFTENFDIEILGTGVSVKNLKEEIVKNGVSVGKFPRLGCFDTVGVGVFASFFIFFTYNGFHLSKFIDVTGESLQIRIVFNDHSSSSDKNKVKRVRKDDFLYFGGCFDYLEKNFAPQYAEIVKYYCIIFKKFQGKVLDSRGNIQDVILHIRGLFKEKDILEIFKPDKKTKACFKNCVIV